MRVLPICPLQAGYSVEPDDGISAVKLDGGASRRERVSDGNVAIINVAWHLTADQFNLLSGFHRNWRRTLEPFLAGLIMESAALELHESSFVPNTFRLTGKNGPSYAVSAQLEVVPLDIYLDPDTDPGGAYAMLYELYGAQAWRIVNELDLLVNRDLPHA